MASGTTLKVRFVMCPKCFLVLPEVADVPVYKCGGCGTILKAKNQQTNSRNIISLKETEASETNKVMHEPEQGESISSNHKAMLAFHGECLSERENGDRQDKSRESNEEKPDLNFSFEGKPLNQEREKKQNGSGDCTRKELRVTLSKDKEEDGSKRHKVLYKKLQGPGVSNEVYSSTELFQNGKEEQSSLVAGKSEVEENDLSSEIRGIKQVETIDNSNARSLSADDEISPIRIESTVPANGPTRENISSDNLTSDEPIEQSQEINHHGISRVTSTDTFYSTDFVDPSSGPSGATASMSKSATVRRAHEGSFSSFDGMDDPLPDQCMDSLGNTYKVPNSFVPEEKTRRDKFLLGSMKSSISGTHDRGRNFSSDLSDKKHYTTKCKRHRNNVEEHRRHSHQVRNWTRFERAEYPSQVPIPQRDSLTGEESGSTASQFHDEFRLRSNFYPLDEPENIEKEKMKLLRMVYELQDQLQKSNFFNRRGRSEVTWNKKRFPGYYDYEAPEKEVFYPSYPERNQLRSNWSQWDKYSGIPFSGDTVNSRHQVDHSCSCYHPKDWRSAPLPPQALYRNRGFCRVHPDHDCYNPNSLWPSIPKRCTKIQSYEVMSDDQRYKDGLVNKYPREKHGTAKRHLRPTAGGAPFATCNSCSSLLQLPADFLLSKRGLHQLKCGVCSEILKFPLENGIRLVTRSLQMYKDRV